MFSLLLPPSHHSCIFLFYFIVAFTLICSGHIEELIPSLKDMCLSASPEILLKKMDTYCEQFRTSNPEYATYMKMMWCERNPMASWAYFGRPSLVCHIFFLFFLQLLIIKIGSDCCWG
jgi:hypothetical protein